MDKWISIAAVTMATTVAACTVSQQIPNVQPILSIDGKVIKDNGSTAYERGKQLLSQGRLAVAAQAFQAALFADGSSTKVLNALAVTYDKLGRYDLSDRYYERALALNSSDPQTVNNLAVSLAQRGAPDLAVKVLADAQSQRPKDEIIAANLKLAQQQNARSEPLVPSDVSLPAPTRPQVPRIEQTGPSSQKLVTIDAARTDAVPRQKPVTPVTVDPIAGKVVFGRKDAVPAEFVSIAPVQQKIFTEALAPLPNTASSGSDRGELATGPRQHAGPVADANQPKTTEKAADVVIRKPLAAETVAPNESALTTLARSRLGSRIAESNNIQPIALDVDKSTKTELALERLGVRLEVANGAGRRFMAARMRTFLDGRGFDVARVINAQSFDHAQTVIIYRDQFEPAALELAKALATNVEFMYAADLPVDIRLILGRDLLSFDRTLRNGG